jgi:flagellar biogenesis protein FliO
MPRPPERRRFPDDASDEAGIAQILLLVLVLLAIVALTIWIVQQFN